MQTDYPFAVQIELASSIIIGQRLTLDAILAAAIFERTRSVEEAHTTIPLSKRHDVWNGSAALLEGPAPIRTVSVIQSLRAKLDLTPDMIKPEKRGYPRIETARGSYRNQMSTYTAYDTKLIWFTGHGNIEAVRSLLKDLPAIGTKRKIGYGKITKVEVSQTDMDDAGVIFSDGSPARPIPEDAWNSRNGIDCDMALEACCPPYWNSQRILCAIPQHQIVDLRHARKLIGNVGNEK